MKQTATPRAWIGGLRQGLSVVTSYAPITAAQLLQTLPQQPVLANRGKTTVKVATHKADEYSFTITKAVADGWRLRVQMSGTIRRYGSEQAQVTAMSSLSGETVFLLALISILLLGLTLYKGYFILVIWLFILSMTIPACIFEINRLRQALFDVLTNPTR